MQGAILTDEQLLNYVCKGTPLVLVSTGERVYFRSARYSPHACAVLAVVADEAQNMIAVEPVELRRVDYGDDE